MGKRKDCGKEHEMCLQNKTTNSWIEMDWCKDCLQNQSIKPIDVTMNMQPIINHMRLSAEKYMKEITEHAKKEWGSYPLFRDVLFDFLRKLPEDYDSGKMTVKQAYELIDKFMKTHLG